MANLDEGRQPAACERRTVLEQLVADQVRRVGSPAQEAEQVATRAAADLEDAQSREVGEPDVGQGSQGDPVHLLHRSQDLGAGK